MFCPLPLTLCPHEESQTCKHTLHISIYGPKTPVDHLCVCVCVCESVHTPQSSAYIRWERIKGWERNNEMCFLTSMGRRGGSRHHMFDSDAVCIKLTFTRRATDPFIISQALWACRSIFTGWKASLLSTACPLAWWDMTLHWSEWRDLQQWIIRLKLLIIKCITAGCDPQKWQNWQLGSVSDYDAGSTRQESFLDAGF